MKTIYKRILSLALTIAFCFGVTSMAGGATEEFFVVEAVTVSDYYTGITATGGNALLGQVHDLITTTHKKYTSYNDCKNPSYVKQTDPGTNGAVCEFYSQADISSSWGSGNPGTWNREHVWCQSLSGGLWGTSGGGSDMHHIRPSESALNSTRGNNKFGEISGGSEAWYKDSNRNKVALGGYVSGGVFEPLDNVKGDVARIVMYVYTHYNTYRNVYGTTNGSGNSGSFGTLKYTNVMYATSEDKAIKMLLQWHNEDPVDSREITRNNAVYNIQGNRNPFIDNPEYANAIWGDGSEIDPPVKLQSIYLNTSALALGVGQTGKLTAYPNPSNASAEVIWSSSDTSVATVSSNGTVTAVSAGTATVTAVSKQNSSITATAEITVQDGEISYAEEFYAAVADINPKDALDRRFNCIRYAVSVYGMLSQEEKAEAESTVLLLQQAIDEYNEEINGRNGAAETAEKNALASAGCIFNK